MRCGLGSSRVNLHISQGSGPPFRPCGPLFGEIDPLMESSKFNCITLPLSQHGGGLRFRIDGFFPGVLSL